MHATHNHKEDVVRAQLNYDFHITSNVGISPTLSADRVDDDTNYVYGVSFTYMF